MGDPLDASGQRFGRLIQSERKRKGLTQEALAESMSVSVATVQRLERGMCLPTSVRHSFGQVASALDLDLLKTIKECYTIEAIEASIFAPRSVDRQLSADRSLDGRQDLGQFFDWVGKQTAVGRISGLTNERAMTYLVALEREFSGYELVVSNQPPFFLFADHEYILGGSSSFDASEEDLDFYHSLMFEHQAWCRQALASGRKRYQIVLSHEANIEFFANRSSVRSINICLSVLQHLQLDGFELVITTSSPRLDEIEVISRRYPMRTDETMEAVSVRHRRVPSPSGTGAYELHLTTTPGLVASDYSGAIGIWEEAVRSSPESVPESKLLENISRPIAKVAASMLLAAVEAAHPKDALTSSTAFK